MEPEYIDNATEMVFSDCTQEQLDADVYVGNIQERISERLWSVCSSRHWVYLHLIHPTVRERFFVDDVSYDMKKDIATFTCHSDVEDVLVRVHKFSLGYKERTKEGIAPKRVQIITDSIKNETKNSKIKII